jgi:hypothetical protein
VFLFPNGVTAVCDSMGLQVGRLQKPWLRLVVDFLQAEGVDVFAAEFFLPNGNRARILKNEIDYSWEIQPLFPDLERK